MRNQSCVLFLPSGLERVFFSWLYACTVQGATKEDVCFFLTDLGCSLSTKFTLAIFPGQDG